MQVLAEKDSSPTSPKVIVFRTRMGAAAEVPEPPAPQPHHGWHNPSVHGSKAAIAAAIFAGIAMLAACVTGYVNWSNRSDQKTQRAEEQADGHVNALIEAKLSPTATSINDHIDKKVGELGDQLHALDVRIARLEGPLTQRVSKLETRANQQASLAKLLDPNRVLATIRAELEIAENGGKKVSASDLSDYRNVVQTLPSSAHEYWTTAAAIINYQSRINQMSGEAPDPAKVSRLCPGLTHNVNGSISFSNTFAGFVFSDCVVDLDTNSFHNVVFRDSVVRYHGGPVTLDGVRFINCNFVLDASFPEQPKTPRLLLGLLESNQTNVTISSD